MSNQCGAVGTVVLVRPAGQETRGTFQFDSCVCVRGITQSGDCVSLACSVFVVSRWVGRWNCVSVICDVSSANRVCLVGAAQFLLVCLYCLSTVDLGVLDFHCLVWTS